MKTLLIRTVARAKFSVAFGLLCLCSVACSNPPAHEDPAAPTNASSATANTNKPTIATPPQNPGTVKPPLGMEDTIEGRVIGLACYKQNPKASLEEQKACAKEHMDKGGQLGLISPDGTTIFVDAHPDARVTNAKLRDFVGEEVTIQGQMLGDVDVTIPGATVKKFDFKLVRRKGSAPPGMPANMPKPKQSDVKRPPAPKKG